MGVEESLQRSDWIASICNSSDPDRWPGWNSTTLAEAGIPPSLVWFQNAEFFSSNVALIAVTLYVWEYLIMLPSEIQMYISVPWKAPQFILFVLVRYSTVGALAVGVYSLWHDPSKSCTRYPELTTAVVQFAISSVLGWRAIAIWEKDVRIVVFVCLLLVTLMVFSALITLSLEEKLLPNGSCILIQGSEDDFFPMPWFYFGSVLYDAIVIVLSTYRLWRHHDDVAPFLGEHDIVKTGKTTPAWGEWIKSQWNSRTPLLFRMTSNGILYLAISTLFNFACFIIGHWSENYGRALLVLYASVMCVVCQHILMLEIRTIWGLHTTVAHSGWTDKPYETDDLIEKLCHASAHRKSTQVNSDQELTRRHVDAAAATSTPLDTGEIVLSSSIDSCIITTTQQQTSDYNARSPTPFTSRDKLISSLSADSGNPTSRKRNEGVETGTVLQLHDFQPSVPAPVLPSRIMRARLSAPDLGTFPRASQELRRTPSASQSIGSSRENIELSTSKNVGGLSVFRQRIGSSLETCRTPKLLKPFCKKACDNKSPKSPLNKTIAHPLEPSPTRDITHDDNRLERIHSRSDSQQAGIHRVCSCCSESGMPLPPATSTRTVTSEIEVADLLASMTDDAKAVALTLAGMEENPPDRTYEPTYRHPSHQAASEKTTQWLMHPPLM